MLKFKMVVEAIGNGVCRIDDPEAFFFARFTPFEVASCSHEALENLREVTGVQDDQTHAFKNTLMDFGDDLVFDVIMRHVSPPDQDVGFGKDFIGEAMFRLIKGGGAD